MPLATPLIDAFEPTVVESDARRGTVELHLDGRGNPRRGDTSTNPDPGPAPHQLGGAGSEVLVGLSQSRNIGVGAVYGIGGTMAVGAGDLIVVGNANADNLGVAFVVLIGGKKVLDEGASRGCC